MPPWHSWSVRWFEPIGHRGAKGRMPENSLEGFHWVADRGIQAVECDVRSTADGVLICSHDPTSARLGGPPDLLSDLPFAAVRKIRLTGGTRIPALNDVLDLLVERTGVVIEIKNSPKEPDFSDARRTAELVACLLEERYRSGINDRVRAVSSFDVASVVQFAEASPHFAHSAALVSPRRSRGLESAHHRTRPRARPDPPSRGDRAARAVGADACTAARDRSDALDGQQQIDGATRPRVGRGCRHLRRSSAACPHMKFRVCSAESSAASSGGNPSRTSRRRRPSSMSA